MIIFESRETFFVFGVGVELKTILMLQHAHHSLALKCKQHIFFDGCVLFRVEHSIFNEKCLCIWHYLDTRKQILWILMRRVWERAGRARERHQILWTSLNGWCLNAIHSEYINIINIHLLSTNWRTLKSRLTDRLLLIHFSCLRAWRGWWNFTWNVCWLVGCLVGSVDFLAVLMNIHYNEWMRERFSSCSFVPIWFYFCFILFPSRSIISFLFIWWWFFELIWCAGGLPIFNCKWVWLFKLSIFSDLNPFS